VLHLAAMSLMYLEVIGTDKDGGRCYTITGHFVCLCDILHESGRLSTYVSDFVSEDIPSPKTFKFVLY
jgi:hypothetical protein